MRLNLVEFIEATLILKGDCKVVVKPQNAGASMTFTMFELRAMAALAWPSTEMDCDISYPEIWINCFGKLVEVKAGQPFIEDNELQLEHEHEMLIAGNIDYQSEYRETLVEVYTTLEELSPREGSAYALLEWLREDREGGSMAKQDLARHDWEQLYAHAITGGPLLSRNM
jgi:hypothetical protein